MYDAPGRIINLGRKAIALIVNAVSVIYTVVLFSL